MPTYFLPFMLSFALVCGPQQASVNEILLKHFPLNSVDGILTRPGVQLDREVSSDGGGSLRIVTPGPTVVRLLEVAGMDVDDARLIYRARLRTSDVQGKAYLEMWCRFPKLGEYFSRGLDRTLTGTSGWSTLETVFLLKKAQTPDTIRLNLVLTSPGTVWIDDIRLLKSPAR
jgi:hypothetical protein